jgi:hypothetical protein
VPRRSHANGCDQGGDSRMASRATRVFPAPVGSTTLPRQSRAIHRRSASRWYSRGSRVSEKGATGASASASRSRMFAVPVRRRLRKRNNPRIPVGTGTGGVPHSEESRSLFGFIHWTTEGGKRFPGCGGSGVLRTPAGSAAAGQPPLSSQLSRLVPPSLPLHATSPRDGAAGDLHDDGRAQRKGQRVQRREMGDHDVSRRTP